MSNQHMHCTCNHGGSFPPPCPMHPLAHVAAVGNVGLQATAGAALPVGTIGFIAPDYVAQMVAHARAAGRTAGLEEAAKVCEAVSHTGSLHFQQDGARHYAAKECATKIRALAITTDAAGKGGADGK